MGPVDSHVISLRKLCMERGPICQTSINEMTDPIVMALLDVGILVPVGGSVGLLRVDFANKLTRSLLLAWTDAHLEELPWQQRLQCRWLLWQNGLGSGSSQSGGGSSSGCSAAGCSGKTDLAVAAAKV